MDNEFPDPEDEFDLEHEDEYEILREIEGLIIVFHNKVDFLMKNFICLML